MTPLGEISELTKEEILDEKIFETIFGTENQIARTRLNNEEDIKEAVQETIIKSYSSIRKLKNSKFFKTWIIKILINEILNLNIKELILADDSDKDFIELLKNNYGIDINI